jgi:hypothetical protein
MSDEKATSPTRMGPGDTTARREQPIHREPPSRNGLLGILVDDWPLKVLALILAVMMWRLTRDRLTRPEEFSDVAIAVDFEGPEGRPKDIVVREVIPQFIKVTVSGTRAQIERAREAFRGNGKRVRVRVPAPEGQAPGGTYGPVTDQLRFVFPFEDAEIVTSFTPAPVVSWVRLEERTVSVRAPEVIVPPEAGVAVALSWPQLERSSVVVRAPAEVLQGVSSIPADPVEAGSWLASKPDLATPMRFETGFELWRAADVSLRSREFCTITPEQVAGTVKFRRTGTRALGHALQLLMPAGAVDDFRGWEVVVDGREYDAGSQRITLPVRADAKTLDDMEARAADWDFAIKVPRPPQAGEPPVQNVKVPVVLTFSPGAAAWSRAGPVPAVLEGSPTVFLTLRKRD